MIHLAIPRFYHRRSARRRRSHRCRSALRITRAMSCGCAMATRLSCSTGTAASMWVASRRGQRARLLLHDPAEREPACAVDAGAVLDCHRQTRLVGRKGGRTRRCRDLLAPARRSVVRLTAARRDKRIERLREIAIAACCAVRAQPNSGHRRFRRSRAGATRGSRARRARRLAAPAADMIARGKGRAAPNARSPLRSGLKAGSTTRETALALRCGYQPCRLGPRVLRTETAGVAALAALQAVAGDLA
jgi:16S rRNA (uracil1498-N3)-methyltransferase